MPAIGGGMNTFTPTFDPAASGSLQVEYTRNPASFKLNRYTRLVPVEATSGRYLRIDPIQNTRVKDVNDGRWPYGQDRPKGKTYDFSFHDYTTERFTDGFQFPLEPVQQAKWPVMAASARTAAQIAMTRRALRTATLLQNASNYPTGQAPANTNAIVGAAVPWDSTNSATKGIQKTIRAVARAFARQTGGVIRLSDIVMVMGPGTADRMASSVEIEKYVINYEKTIQFLQYRGDFDQYGLPPNLFGLGDVVVEDTVRTSTERGAATQTTDFMWGDGKVVFLHRPGGLLSENAATEMPDFAAVGIFAYEDMTVEVFANGDDAIKHRRVDAYVNDNSVPVLMAPAGAIYLQDCFT